MKKVIFTYKDISAHRSEIMGWSILWIMMLHFTFQQIKPLGFIAQYGFAGVDIFLFVSGFGLFFSLDKNTDLISFYRKRLFRIFPTYFIVGIFASIFLFHDSLFTYIFRYTTIGYWIGSVYWEWYIPTLVVLYLFAPLFKKMLDRKMFYVFFSLAISSFVGSLIIIDKDIIDREHFFSLYRIPAFLWGMICAYWYKDNIPTKYFFFFLILGIPFFIIFYPNHHLEYNYKYFSLIFLLPSFVLIFVLISKISFLKISNCITSIGQSSLEIYLIQSILFSATLQGIITVPPKWHDTLTIILITTSSLLGIFVHRLINRNGSSHKTYNH